jgi:hypothetical protein
VYTDTNGLVTGIKGAPVVEDVKGKITDVFKLKAKLFVWRFPHLKFILTKAKYRSITSEGKKRSEIKAYTIHAYDPKKRWKEMFATSLSTYVI